MIGGAEVTRAGVAICGAGVGCGGAEAGTRETGCRDGCGHTGRSDDGAVVVLLLDDQGGQDAIEGNNTGCNDQQVFFRLHPVKVHL